MRISVKTRYALSALICIARSNVPTKRTTVFSLSEKLKISKIYLEQVFILLKQAGLVDAAKGAHGGYLLTRSPQDINVYEIFTAIEPSLTERTQNTVADSYEPNVETAMHNVVFGPLDEALYNLLSNITLEDLVTNVNTLETKEIMYYL